MSANKNKEQDNDLIPWNMLDHIPGKESMEIEIQRLKEILVEDPEEPDVLNDIGDLYYSLGDLDQAEEYYRRSFSIDPAYSAISLGEILIKKGLFDEALEVLLEGFNQQEPLLIRTVKYILIAYKELGQLERGLDFAYQAFFIDDMNIFVADFLVDYAKLISDEEYLEALRRVACYYPSYWVPYGFSLIEKGEYGEVVAKFEELIEYHPKESDLWEVLAEAQWKSGKKRLAEQTNRTALSLRPNSPHALERASRIASGLGNFGESLEFAEKGIQIQENIIKDYRKETAKKRKPDSEDRLFRLSSEYDPYPAMQKLLASLFVRKIDALIKIGQKEKAVKVIRVCRKKFPDKSIFPMFEALLLFFDHRLDESLKVLSSIQTDSQKSEEFFALQQKILAGLEQSE